MQLSGCEACIEVRAYTLNERCKGLSRPGNRVVVEGACAAAWAFSSGIIALLRWGDVMEIESIRYQGVDLDDRPIDTRQAADQSLLEGAFERHS